MEVSILEKRQREKRLIFVFFGIVIITLLLLYFGYFKQETPVEIVEPEIMIPERKFEEKKLEIDFKILEHPFLKEMKEFPPIEKIDPEKIGRENPFLPY